MILLKESNFKNLRPNLLVSFGKSLVSFRPLRGYSIKMCRGGADRELIKIWDGRGEGLEELRRRGEQIIKILRRGG